MIFLKKINLIIITIFLSLILQGCDVLTSIYPFYTAELIIKAPEATGSWQLFDENGKLINQPAWIFSDGKIQTFTEEGISESLKATYFRLNGDLYLDTTADKPRSVSKWWIAHVLPIHRLYKVEVSGDYMTLYYMNDAWLKEKLKSQKFGLRYLRPDYSSEDKIFISPSSSWVEFLWEFGEEPKAFQTAGYKFVRIQSEQKTY